MQVVAKLAVSLVTYLCLSGEAAVVVSILGAVIVLVVWSLLSIVALVTLRVSGRLKSWWPALEVACAIIATFGIDRLFRAIVG